MQCWKDIQEDYRTGNLSKYIKEHYPESSDYYGIMVAVPNIYPTNDEALCTEYEKPTPLNDENNWKLCTVIPCREGPRHRSTVELLFCMLRSKHSNTNQT